VAHRTITDSLGARWQVWAVRPGARHGVGSGSAPPTAFAPGYADGWLAFERLAGPGPTSPLAPAEKRRHAPIPPGWDEAPDAALAGWLAAAVPAARPAAVAEADGPSRRERP
jgi:hypothetical protein